MSDKRFSVQEDANSDKILLLIDNEQMKMWSFLAEEREAVEKIGGLLNELNEENKYLKKRIKVISDELYCKDRKLEELGVPIECCDKK